jgi:hypothetical protein
MAISCLPSWPSGLATCRYASGRNANGRIDPFRESGDPSRPHPIEWDQSKDGSVPLLVIDGKEVSWDELGRMLMTFEGWQFRLAICDRSDEV